MATAKYSVDATPQIASSRLRIYLHDQRPKLGQDRSNQQLWPQRSAWRMLWRASACSLNTYVLADDLRNIDMARCTRRLSASSSSCSSISGCSYNHSLLLTDRPAYLFSEATQISTTGACTADPPCCCCCLVGEGAEAVSNLPRCSCCM